MIAPPVWQLAAIAVAGTLCAITLRRQTPELSLVLAVVTAGLLLLRCASALRQLVGFLSSLADLAGLTDELLSPLVRTVGIAVLVRLAAQLCRDGGMSSAAVMLELGGVLAALAASVPLMQSVLGLLEGLL